MARLRTSKTHKTYQRVMKRKGFKDQCNLCQKTKTLKDYKYWRIVDNKFPWDNVAKVHHMIIPKRHVTYYKLTKTEKLEYDKIKLDFIEDFYDLIAEATNKKKSIPGHFHVHLMIMKKR